MQFLILGLALLVLVLLAGRAFARANPKSLAQNIKSAAGWVLLVLCIFLTLTGRFAIAIPLAFFAFTLLGFGLPWQDALGKASKSEGQRSSVRTEMLEMVLDHDTGEMDGVVQKGRFTGRRLSQLTGDEMNILLQEAWERDTQAAQLLEAFIERSGHRSSYSGQSGRGPSTGGAAMTIDEAYAVLGLSPGASREEIQQAHRALMKKYHPDQGGTTYLASKINEAKEILLKHVR